MATRDRDVTHEDVEAEEAQSPLADRAQAVQRRQELRRVRERVLNPGSTLLHVSAVALENSNTDDGALMLDLFIRAQPRISEFVSSTDGSKRSRLDNISLELEDVTGGAVLGFKTYPADPHPMMYISGPSMQVADAQRAAYGSTVVRTSCPECNATGKSCGNAERCRAARLLESVAKGQERFCKGAGLTTVHSTATAATTATTAVRSNAGQGAAAETRTVASTEATQPTAAAATKDLTGATSAQPPPTAPTAAGTTASGDQRTDQQRNLDATCQDLRKQAQQKLLEAASNGGKAERFLLQSRASLLRVAAGEANKSLQELRLAHLAVQQARDAADRSSTNLTEAREIADSLQDTLTRQIDLIRETQRETGAAKEAEKNGEAEASDDEPDPDAETDCEEEGVSATKKTEAAPAATVERE